MHEPCAWGKHLAGLQPAQTGKLSHLAAQWPVQIITPSQTPGARAAGPVALRLDWNGLSVTYSGDTRPTQGLVDLAQGSDVLLLQNMGPIAVSTGELQTGHRCTHCTVSAAMPAEVDSLSATLCTLSQELPHRLPLEG